MQTGILALITSTTILSYRLDDALPSLHLSKSTLVKELLWLKNNNQLLDYDDNSKQLLQEVQTVQNLKWLTPYYQTLPFTSTSSNARLQTPLARSKTLGSSFKLPFTTNEVISFKNSYSHQPNIIDHIDEVADQSRKDSYVLKRVSELEKKGLMRSRVIPMTGKQIESSSNRAALHVEMEQIAEIFAERRAEKLERLQTIAEVYLS
jgi:hypothetical protein